MYQTIIDLTPEYLQWAVHKRSLETYCASYPSFFEHYFVHWGKDANSKPLILSETEVNVRKQSLLKIVSELVSPVNDLNFDFKRVIILLFVGQGTANGHGFIDGNKVIAWYALESLPTETQQRVFVIHELIHAIHYSVNPSAYFGTSAEKNSMSRQLITEGIATYLTMEIATISEEESIWADYLSPTMQDAWFTSCRKQQLELYQYALNHFDGVSNDFFLAADPDDIYRYRAGYYIGLKIIEKIVIEEAITPKELLMFPMEALLARARAVLTRKASVV